MPITFRRVNLTLYYDQCNMLDKLTEHYKENPTSILRKALERFYFSVEKDIKDKK